MTPPLPLPLPLPVTPTTSSTTPAPANAIATATCPVGYGKWNATTCKPCPVGWTTTSGGATQDMWQGCTVPCSEAMMSDAVTGCKGAWYQTMSYPLVYGDAQAVSCTAKCAEKGLQCNWQALNFTSTVGHTRSVFDLLGVLSSCNCDARLVPQEFAASCLTDPSTIAIGWWGPGQMTCGGCGKTCFYQNVVQPNSCDEKHWDFKRMCPCG